MTDEQTQAAALWTLFSRRRFECPLSYREIRAFGPGAVKAFAAYLIARAKGEA